MASDLFHALSDLSKYARVGFEKGVAPLLKKTGEDFTARKYKDYVREAVERIHPRRMKLRVSAVIQETPSAKTFRFERIDGPLPPFRAGQYVNLFIEANGVRTSRPFSISSAPRAPHLDLTVRDRPGGFVAPYMLSNLRQGDVVETTGPAGSFLYEPLIDGDDLVFLAGGSGVTPFMSILREQEMKDWPLRIHLLYGSRNPKDVIFGEELTLTAKNHERFTYTPVISEPPKSWRGAKGFLDAKLIRREVGDLSGKTFFVCGPGAMYDLCTEALDELGVPVHRIRRELYGPPADVTKSPGWPVRLSPNKVFKVDVDGSVTVDARAGEPLIAALERGGVLVPALCRSGECSACRTRILAGRVFMPPHTGVRESDAAMGYVHACVAYPLENLKIRL